MTNTLTEIDKEKKIEEKEFSAITKLMYTSIVKSPKKDKSFLENQKILITLFTQILNKYLEFHMLDDKKIKLEFINFIDKLNLQKELLSLEQGEIKADDLKKTAQRFGDKAQSSFSTK